MKRGEPGYVSPLKGKRSAHATDEHMAKMRALSVAKRAGITMEDRFWAKVNKDGPVFEDKGPCWIWTGSKNNTGYGQLYSNRDGDPFMITAHRFSLRLVGIFLENGMDGGKPVCDHLCKNRLCVNPAHIRVTTQQVNSTENSDHPTGKNWRKTHCDHGHPFSGDNLAIYTRPNGAKTRVCLTCNPNYWRWAVIPREAPPGARKPLSKHLRSEVHKPNCSEDPCKK